MNLFSFDLETHQIQPGLLAPPIVCGSTAHREGGGAPVGKLLAPGEILDKLEGFAEAEELPVFVGANIAYDFGCVVAARPYLLPFVFRLYEHAHVFDVQIAAALNAIHDGRMRDGELFAKDGTRISSGRYSLKECAREWLGRDDAKERDRWRLSYALLADVPMQHWPYDARQYPVDDAVNTLLVAEAQLAHGACNNLHDLPNQAYTAFCLHLSSMWGLRTDAASVEEMRRNVDNHVHGLKLWAKEQGLLKPKSKKPDCDWSKDTKKLKALVEAAYGGQPPTTDGGGTSLSRETLTDSGDEVLQKFAELGKWEKFNTYLPSIELAAKVPLNVSPNILLATGRTSYDGIIQLIPRKGGVRECFTARQGHVWSSVDYAAIELSTLAQVCLTVVGYSDLAEVINEGKDAHSLLGADLLNITYEDFIARKKELKDIRQAGKAANFGFPGMMGAAKFVIAKLREGSSVCEWFFNDGRCKEERIREYKEQVLATPLCARCVEQAEVLRTTYLTRWSEIRPYWNWVMREIETRDAVTQLVSERVRGGVHGPAGANTMFQGLAADGAKSAVRQITREMYLRGEAMAWACEEPVVEALRAEYGSSLESPLYGSRLVNFSHDETIIEIPDTVSHEAAMRQSAVMVGEMKKYVPDVRVSAEPALMRRWYKAAEAVYDKAGKLIPWEPEA